MVGMPLPPVPVQSGFNCVVVAKINGKRFRVVLESGAARSLIRTNFAQQLRKNKNTKIAAYGLRPLSQPVVLEGVIKGHPSATIRNATQLRLEMTDTQEGHSETL